MVKPSGIVTAVNAVHSLNVYVPKELHEGANDIEVNAVQFEKAYLPHLVIPSSIITAVITGFKLFHGAAVALL